MNHYFLSRDKNEDEKYNIIRHLSYPGSAYRTKSFSSGYMYDSANLVQLVPDYEKQSLNVIQIYRYDEHPTNVLEYLESEFGMGIDIKIEKNINIYEVYDKIYPNPLNKCNCSFSFSNGKFRARFKPVQSFYVVDIQESGLTHENFKDKFSKFLKNTVNMNLLLDKKYDKVLSAYNYTSELLNKLPAEYNTKKNMYVSKRASPYISTGMISRFKSLVKNHNYEQFIENYNSLTEKYVQEIMMMIFNVPSRLHTLDRDQLVLNMNEITLRISARGSKIISILNNHQKITEAQALKPFLAHLMTYDKLFNLETKLEELELLAI